MVDISRPVFIIGGSRTGSEMLKTMLSASAELDFVDELFLLCPRWLHRDLNTNIRASIGKRNWADATSELVDLFYSGTLYGWFWENLASQIERERLSEVMHRNRPNDLPGIFACLMEAHAAQNGKARAGAKFPMHYGYSHLLLDWFPSASLIHTTRDPRAVYASQANKYVTDEMSSAKRAFIKAQHFTHINIQIVWTARLHRKFSDLPNYMLVNYEEVVSQPETQLRRICDFVQTDFDSNMLTPEQYGSSFRAYEGARGIRTDSLSKWRNKISPMTAWGLRKAHRRNMDTLGYE